MAEFEGLKVNDIKSVSTFLVYDELLKKGIEVNASDILISVGLPVNFRVMGDYRRYDDYIVTETDAKELAKQIITPEQVASVENAKEVDKNYTAYGYSFRINVFMQMGHFGIATRLLNNKIKSLEELGLPSKLREFCRRPTGLVLVTGATGSGKSTTLAAMVDVINSERNCHIITVEQPIEYIYSPKKSIITQKEVGRDTLDFANSLRSIFREDPDVIVIGEMRDLETIGAALTAAETGHLVLSTLHTRSATSTIDRIIDVFPETQHAQVKTQLSSVLIGVVSQMLIPSYTLNKRVAAYEVMIMNPAIRSLIRMGKNHQIASTISMSQGVGMNLMDKCLEQMYKDKIISYEQYVANLAEAQ
ncbi:MAG: PilT/PilU family type 4a pilus ATPase [Clostridia bacterium]|nr:PilT/PilU family type 4a pilus ATPase [Clostridia bacterium]